MRVEVYRCALVILLLLVGACNCSANVLDLPSGLTSLEFVTVGDAGNVPDSRYNEISVGSVAYEYQLGKYEVTTAQYAEFLNAVASEDVYQLYTAPMSSPAGCGIERSGLPGNYTYSVASDWANRPVNWVSLWDAMRFANWLHNGQPAGPQGPATTEDGAYLIGGYVGSDGSWITRRAGAKYWVPSEDEWYKAAYHVPAEELGGVYYDYPTQAYQMPGNDISQSTNSRNNANIAVLGNFAIGSPYYTTEVGTFYRSAGPYGTFDQGGNLAEWNEAIVYDGPSSDLRQLRGGSYPYTYQLLRANFRDATDPGGENRDIGFRIARAVPEPSALALAVFPLIAGAFCRQTAWQASSRLSYSSVTQPSLALLTFLMYL